MPPVGRYFTIKSHLNGLVLDIKGADISSGTEVITYDFHGNDNQLWYSDPVGDVIRSKINDDYVLDLCDDNKLVIREYEAGRSSQRWLCYANYLRQVETGKVADISGANADPGANVTVWEQHGGDHQKWTFEYQSRQYFEIRSRMNDKALDISGSAMEPGANVVLWEPHGGDNQLWYEDRHGNIYSKLNGLTIKCGDDGLVTAPLDMSDDHVSLIRDGAFIENRTQDTECLDVMGENSDDGAKVGMYQRHGGDNQRWYWSFV